MDDDVLGLDVTVHDLSRVNVFEAADLEIVEGWTDEWGRRGRDKIVVVKVRGC